jgi:superfamily II DNA or RNA helicase
MKTDIVLRDYQFEPYNFLNSDFDKLVLAMCPSSGKTETVIYYINELIKKNKHLKVLILPHSTNVLLNNFYDRLEQRNVCFTYSTDTSKKTNVHVILPQSTSKIKDKYDVVIIDEAHENYFAKTVQNIIKKTSPKKQILLTGTPYKFIGKDDFKIHFLALNELDKNTIPKLRVDIIESYYDWNGNYNYNNEIKKQFNFKDSDTKKSIEKTFKFITNRSGSNSISKTLIVCNNINQSKSVKSYLDSIGLFSVISNSENDTKSELVQGFKHNKINILIVVNRARLGYDDTDLINLIDMSGTLNPNLIYQMMARVLRGSNDSQKYYIRLTSKKDDLLNSEISTSLALMLTDKKYISTFNGKDFSSKKIIIPNYFSKKNIGSSSNKGSSSKILKDTDDIISFYRDTLIEVEKNAGVYKFCEIQDVLNLLDPKNKKHTLETCKIIASKYKTRSEWSKQDANSYSCAVRKKWLDECCKHMKVLSEIHTLETCKISASKYKTRTEWVKKDKKLYYYASKKGWLTECCKHMKALNITHNLDDCKISASKYNSRSEWAEKETNLYYYARKNGYLNECCKHMNILKKIRTLEMCKKSAFKYKSRGQWEKKDRKSYIYASRKGWLNECCKHMKTLMNKNTLSDCKNDALKCESKIEWVKKYPSTYYYARRNKLMTECCKHMKILKTTHTLNNCIEIALKYESRIEWHKKDNKSYAYACKNKLLDKCCQHMKKNNK